MNYKKVNPSSSRHFLVLLFLASAASNAFADEFVQTNKLTVHESLVAETAEPATDNALEIEIPATVIDAKSPNETPGASNKNASMQEEDNEGPAMLVIDDPWEGYNRSIYSFNKKADKYVIRPIAVAYDKITPKPVQQGVRNFFSNLKAPTTLINELLQGRPIDSTKTLGRFSVNTTVGILGIFDPASHIGLEQRNEDFGQTLATWGWENSNYVVMPLLGPITMRDVVGFIGDTPTNPMNYADGGGIAALQSVEITDMRSQMLPMDDLMTSAIDEYAMMRDAWSAGRAKEIREGTEPQIQAQGQAGTSLLQRIFQ